jgi:Trm5-related predicted tRNA methylase
MGLPDWVRAFKIGVPAHINHRVEVVILTWYRGTFESSLRASIRGKLTSTPHFRVLEVNFARVDQTSR